MNFDVFRTGNIWFLRLYIVNFKSSSNDHLKSVRRESGENQLEHSELFWEISRIWSLSNWKHQKCLVVMAVWIAIPKPRHWLMWVGRASAMLRMPRCGRCERVLTGGKASHRKVLSLSYKMWIPHAWTGSSDRLQLKFRNWTQALYFQLAFG